METEEEVKELEKILESSEFEPIESPLKRWFKALKSKL